MRLIDADRLKEVFSRNVVGGNAYFDLIDAQPTIERLESDKPSDSEITLTFSQGTLKYSCKDYVVYKKDWLKSHYGAEIDIMFGDKQYLSDKPSGKWEHITYYDGGYGMNETCSNCGHTIHGQIFDLVDKYCPNCGSRNVVEEQGENV